jgi:hypothetical protein
MTDEELSRLRSLCDRRKTDVSMDGGDYLSLCVELSDSVAELLAEIERLKKLPANFALTEVCSERDFAARGIVLVNDLEAR